MAEKNGLTGEVPVVQRVKSEDTDTAAPEVSTAKQKAQPRKKVTSQDVEAWFTARRAASEERKATREPREMAKLVRAVIATVLGVGIIGFGLGISNAGTQHTTDVKVNESKVVELKGALETLSQTDSKASAQKLADSLAAAQKRSDELAAAQQQFAVIAYGGNADPGTNDGRPKASVLKALDQRKVVAQFFDPSSFILTDDQVYKFRTEVVLASDQIDPRLPWFLRYESAGKAADPQSFAWKTASVALSGTPDVLSVVWTNTDAKTGDLLAWATARYSVKTNTLTNLIVNTTTRGGKA